MVGMLLSPVSKILPSGMAKIVDPIGSSMSSAVKSGDPMKIITAPVTALKDPIDSLTTPKSQTTIAQSSKLSSLPPQDTDPNSNTKQTLASTSYG